MSYSDLPDATAINFPNLEESASLLGHPKTQVSSSSPHQYTSATKITDSAAPITQQAIRIFTAKDLTPSLGTSLKDKVCTVGKTIPAVLLLVINKIINCITSLGLGIYKLTTKPNTLKNPAVEALKANLFPNGSYSSADWKTENWKSKDRDINNKMFRSLETVYTLAAAYKHCAVQSKIDPEVEKTYLQQVQQQIDLLKDHVEQGLSPEKDLSKIIDTFKKCLKKQDIQVSGEEFKEAVVIARGNVCPTAVFNPIKGTNNNGEHPIIGEEELTQYSKEASIDYLSARNGTVSNYSDQLAFLKNNTLRLSPLKSQAEMQGMTINGHEHVLKDAAGKESAPIFRSGAFAVHGRDKVRAADIKVKIGELAKNDPARQELIELKHGIKKSKNMGLSRLSSELVNVSAAKQEIDAMVDGELKTRSENKFHKMLRTHFGVNSLAEFKQEISIRRDFCIAQALPEIMASIKSTMKNEEEFAMALASGNFLHSVEGLLSHDVKKEKGMMEDMKGVLDYLSKNIRVQLSDKNEGLEVDSQTDKDNPVITINLKKPTFYQGDNVKLGMTAVNFNTAINAEQAFASFLGSNNFQTEMNAEGLNKLLDHSRLMESSLNPVKFADQLADIAKKRAALEEHYSDKANLETRDMKGLRLRENLVVALGGKKGKKCKSGKDRTGIDTSRSLAENSSLKGISASDLQRKLLAGNSYYATGLNTGHDGYAFNEIQHAFIPEQMELPRHLIGANES